MCGTNIHGSFYEAKCKLRELNLGYKTIHVYKYDCVLFWNEFEDLQQCLTCGESRYMVSSNDRSLGKKLCIKYCSTFHWYRDYNTCLYRKKARRTWDGIRINERKTKDVLRNPADAEGWKHFDYDFPYFALEPRNVCFGLSSYRFNPFGRMSISHNMWLVVLIPYNLLLWKCMKKSNFFMSLLIPNSKSPSREIDVYLKSIIEELKNLQTFGVHTYDCLTN